MPARAQTTIINMSSNESLDWFMTQLSSINEHTKISSYITLIIVNELHNVKNNLLSFINNETDRPCTCTQHISLLWCSLLLTVTATTLFGEVVILLIKLYSLFLKSEHLINTAHKYSSQIYKFVNVCFI